MTGVTRGRGRLQTDGRWFRDATGRAVALRGVNLGGSSKVPAWPDGATHRREGFYDHRGVSFVGRPFPLAEADEHFGRLRAWGLTFQRLLTTWEAVEHPGPGQYDEDYLTYLRAVVEKAAEYGIDVFIDPHQDVWSRWTGGDGAPGWTLEAVGMDLTRLAPTGAAIVHQEWGDPFPWMIWPTNYGRLGCATMFTLFFAGDDFAPRTTVDGVPVQEYLQGHFLRAMAQVAEALRGLPNVVGYNSLNEPGAGYIGLADLREHVAALGLPQGPTPTALEGMLLASGRPVEVGVWAVERFGSRRTGTTLLNPEGRSLWRAGHRCVWQENGVYTADGTPLRPDHFAVAGDPAQTFADRYLKPFTIRYAATIHAVAPDALIFLEGVPNGAHPHWGSGDPAGVVNAAHWYDGPTLLSKHYDPARGLDPRAGRPVEGAAAVSRAYVEQLAAITRGSAEAMGGIPTLIGETGLPFDLDEGQAFRDGDFSAHVAALDNYFDALDANLLNVTLWNYTADNTNARGDGWNGEDLSIFSRDQQADPSDVNSGGRALAGVVRPYAIKTAGTPLRQSFELDGRVFEYAFAADPAIAAPTEVFVPALQYPDGYALDLSAGAYRRDEGNQVLLVETPGVTGEVIIRVTPAASG